MTQRRRKAVPRTVVARSEVDSQGRFGLVARQDPTPPPGLGSRIFELVYDRPLDEAVPNLGSVLVCLLLAEAKDPLQAVDDLAVLLRRLVVDAQRRGPARWTAPN
jgi:hypothetical protein